MNTEAVYIRLCKEADPAAALDRMGDDTLAALMADLAAGGITTGIPAMVTGLVENEIVRRWTREHLGTAGAVGEGAL